MPFWTDAFGALREGEGRAIDGNSAAADWMGWRTVFYMSWWVAWSCSVGLFIARISKNRTLRSVIIGVFFCPTIYALIWFSCMGGIGLRQERQGKVIVSHMSLPYHVMFSSNFVPFYHKLVSLKSSELLISTILATLFRLIMHSAMMYLKKMSTTQQRVLLYSPIPYPESLQYASLILPNTKWLGLMSCIHLVTQEVEQTLAR